MIRGLLGVFAGLVAAFPLFAAYGYWAKGTDGVWAAGVAALVCLAGGLAGFATVFGFRGLQAVQGVLLSMVVRMAVPFAAAAIFLFYGGSLVRAGLLEMLVGYYLLALTLDTALAVRLVRQNEPARTQSGA
jgi:hypothetical protein